MEKSVISVLYSPDTNTVAVESGNDIIVMTADAPPPIEPMLAQHGYRDEVTRAVQAA